MYRIGVTAGLLVAFLLFSSFSVFAQGAKQYSNTSMIVEVEGSACLGQERSRAQVQKLALAEAKRIASERVMTHVTSETNVQDGKLADDLINAYSKATIRVLEEIEKGWVKSDGSGGYVDDCYRVKIKAEVIPAEVDTDALAVASKSINNPKAPLTVELWTDQETYRIGDDMKFYFRGNKPFYARAVYVDAEGNHIQVTTRGKSKYYMGGVTYEIPGDNDRFVLRISPPLGEEKLILYTSTQPMNSYIGREMGDWFIVSEKYKNLGLDTRGLTVLQGVSNKSSSGKAEFAETTVEVKVKR